MWREVRTLEDALALRYRARTRIKHVATRQLHRARTREESEDIAELNLAIADLDEQLGVLAQFHPDRLEPQ
jgi:hypothetical protein